MYKTDNTTERKAIAERIDSRLYEKRMKRIDLIRTGIPKVSLYKVLKGEGFTIDTLLCICDSLDLEIVLKPKTK